MSDEELIEDALAAMVRKAGVKIQKDDPILLNALVIQTMFREQVELTRQMAEEMIRASASNVNTSAEKFSAKLAENVVVQERNADIFLRAFKEVLAEQAAKKRKPDEVAEALYRKLKTPITVILALQIFIIVALIMTMTLLR